jgi:hypothetical protein
VFVLFLKEIERKEIERKGEKMTISYNDCGWLYI